MRTRLTVTLATAAVLLASCGSPVVAATPQQPDPRPPFHTPTATPSNQGCGRTVGMI